MGWLWALPRPLAVMQQHLLCRPVCVLVVIVAISLPRALDAAALRASFEPSSIAGGAFADGTLSYLQSGAFSDQPAAYWAGAPTPAPPSMGPGPYPNLMWVEQKPLPLPLTTPPVYEQCHGCHCMFVFPDKFVKGGAIANEFTCLGGAATSKVPTIKWVGQPGQDWRNKEGEKCPECSSYAITIEDLDYPNGVGEVNNHIHSIFWAVNIPGTFTELNDVNAFDAESGVVVGINPSGEAGIEAPCPKKGTHRYKTTLWSLNQYLGDDLNPFDPKTAADKVKGELESRELARATFFASLTSPGYQPK